MRLSSAVLVGVTCSFAVACVYFVQELDAEQERAQASAARIRQLDAQIAALKKYAPIAGASALVGQTLSSSAPTPQVLLQEQTTSASAKKIETDEQNQDRARRAQMKGKYSDSASRALIVAAAKVQIRRAHAGIAKELGLTAEQEDALFEQLALQSVQTDELRIDVGPEKDEAARGAFQAQSEAMTREHSDAIAALLGYERYQRYLSFVRTVGERRQIRALRARLDDADALSDDQAARLVAAMYEERERYVAEFSEQARRTGAGVGHTLDGYPVEVYVLHRDSLGRIDREKFAEQRLENVRAFTNRIRTRASAVLTPGQLRRLDEIHEELLTSQQVRMERIREEIRSAARP
jgi:hypothetical protein